MTNNETCTFFTELNGKLQQSEEFPVSDDWLTIPDFFDNIAEVIRLGAADYKTTTTTIKEVPD